MTVSLTRFLSALLVQHPVSTNVRSFSTATLPTMSTIAKIRARRSLLWTIRVPLCRYTLRKDGIQPRRYRRRQANILRQHLPERSSAQTSRGGLLIVICLSCTAVNNCIVCLPACLPACLPLHTSFQIPCIFSFIRTRYCH